MKKNLKNNITKVQRSIAYVLLLSELLTSCGFKENILPSIQPQDPSTLTCGVPKDTSLAASDSTFQLSTTTIAGTKLTFAYTPKAGLQAKYQDPTMAEAIPVEQYPVIQDVTGVKKPFSQLTPAEAQLLAQEGKWEVKEAGLRYLGMRGRGGMQEEGNNATPLGRKSVSSSAVSPKAKAMQKQPSRGTISSLPSLVVPKPSAQTQATSSFSSSTSPKSSARSSIAKAKSLTRQLTQEGTQSARPSVHALATEKAEASAAEAPALEKPTESTPAKQPVVRKERTLSRTSSKGENPDNLQLSTAKPTTKTPAPQESIYDLSQADESLTLALKDFSAVPYKLMTPSSKELEFVQGLYEKTALLDGQIVKVEKIRSRDMSQAYMSKNRLLDRRKGNWIFDPKWTASYLDEAIAKCSTDITSKQQALANAATTEEEKNKLTEAIKALEKQKLAHEKKRSDVPLIELREEVHGRLMDLVDASGLTTDKSGVKEVWMWHGTYKSAAAGIMTSGFASLASRDDGFYGKGLYFSSNLGSIQTAYNPEVLLLSKISFYSAYPVAKSWDLKELYNKNNHDNHDVHYVPTVRKTLPKEVYDALKSSPDAWKSSQDASKSSQDAYRSIPEERTTKRNYPLDDKEVKNTADEFVVFDPSQILLSYRIETTAGAKSSQLFYNEIKQKEAVAQKAREAKEEKVAQGLKEITKEKLKNPKKELTVNESIDVLVDCLQRGKEHAENAKGKDLLIFIGNTGSGKSTLVNYIEGCEMEYIDIKDLGLPGEGEVVRVKHASQKQEVMSIGHTSISTTFMPTIIPCPQDNRKTEFTYCDCPGFFDNRGPEINIANATNIKATLSAAKSIKVIVSINYHLLKADRARGMKETYKILVDMFGGEANLKAHLKSILIVITQVPNDGMNAPKSIDDLRANFKDDLSEFTLHTEEKFLENIITFDVWDETIPGGTKREAFLGKIRNELIPIENPADVINTVLVASDAEKLIAIGEKLEKEIKDGMKKRDYEKVKNTLDTFQILDLINHSYMRDIKYKAMQNVREEINDLYTTITKCIVDGKDQQEGQLSLDKLCEIKEKLSAFEGNTFIDIPLTALYEESKECFTAYESVNKFLADISDKPRRTQDIKTPSTPTMFFSEFIQKIAYTKLKINVLEKFKETKAKNQEKEIAHIAEQINTLEQEHKKEIDRVKKQIKTLEKKHQDRENIYHQEQKKLKDRKTEIETNYSENQQWVNTKLENLEKEQKNPTETYEKARSVFKEVCGFDLENYKDRIAEIIPQIEQSSKGLVEEIKKETTNETTNERKWELLKQHLDKFYLLFEICNAYKEFDCVRESRTEIISAVDKLINTLADESKKIGTQETFETAKQRIKDLCEISKIFYEYKAIDEKAKFFGSLIEPCTEGNETVVRFLKALVKSSKRNLDHIKEIYSMWKEFDFMESIIQKIGILLHSSGNALCILLREEEKEEDATKNVYETENENIEETITILAKTKIAIVYKVPHGRFIKENSTAENITPEFVSKEKVITINPNFKKVDLPYKSETNDSDKLIIYVKPTSSESEQTIRLNICAIKPKEPIYDLSPANASAYKGETILDKEGIASMLAGKTPTTHKIIPYFGRHKAEKDNGCRFLSNFYDKEDMQILLHEADKAYAFNCVETYYQCRKCLVSPSEAGKAANKAEMIQAFQACDPKASKKLANQEYFTFDARQLSEMDDIMFAGLLQKFPNDLSNPLTQKLLRTGDAILVEGNEWGDKSWGMVYDANQQTFEGENKLGRMLMLIRHARSQGKDDEAIAKDDWKKLKMSKLLDAKLFISIAKAVQGTLLQEAFSEGLPYKLMTPSSKEVAFIQSHYEKTALTSQQISKVEKIRSRDMHKAYDCRSSLLKRRKGSWIFDPKWTASYLEGSIAKCSTEIVNKQQALANAATPEEDKNKLNKAIKALEKQKSAHEKKRSDVPLREAVHGRLMGLVDASGLTTDKSGVKEVWMWHGTSKAAADGVITSGFASLDSRDEGFYGKGLYFSSNLGWIQQGFYPEVLLLSKVCFYSAYPVAKSWDLQDLYNKNNHDNHDVHYAPTFRKPLPKDVYDTLKSSPDAYRSIPADPTKARNYPIDDQGVIPEADEFVVFDPSQILLSYRIETQAGHKDAKDFLEEIEAEENKPVEDTLWKGLELQDITKAKLQDPSKVLSVAESIDVIHDCIQAGKQRVEQAAYRDVIIFLGNSGSGKSSTINYLAGCEMEYIDREAVGIKEGEGEIARVKSSSPKKTLMQIGHTNQSMTFMPTIIPRPSKQHQELIELIKSTRAEIDKAHEDYMRNSGEAEREEKAKERLQEEEQEEILDEDDQTKVAGQAPYNFVYCDCPSFWDTRGPEINIANAVNIRSVVSKAKSIKIMLLLNYYYLKFDRRKCLQETYISLLDLFSPGKVEVKAQITEALAIYIRKAKGEQVGEKEKSYDYIENLQVAIKAQAAQLKDETRKEAHEKAIEDLVNQYQEGQLKQYLPSILIGITQVPNDGITSPKNIDKVRQNFADYPLLHKLAGKDNPNIFTFDLWDETIPGGLDRASILARLSALPAIENTDDVFGSVLLASDEQRLQVIRDALSQGITMSMESNGGLEVRYFLEQAAKLDIVGHPYTQGIRQKLHEQVEAGIQKQKEMIKTLCMSRKFEEPKKLLANMEAMQKHLEGLEGCEKVGELYTVAETHVALAEHYNNQLETIELDIAAQEETLASLKKAIAAGWIKPQSEVDKRKEEISNLASSLSSLKDLRNSTELKMILGNNYLGEEAWRKLDVAVSPEELPAITDDLISRVKAMQTKGEQPIVILDLGKSIADMEGLCTAKGITVLSTKDEGDAKLRAEICYQATVKDFRWLLLPGSDHGVLPGSRSKTYADQVKYMESNYPGYAVGGARELVTVAMLKHSQDGTVLFPGEPATLGNCKEQYQTGDLKGYQMSIGYVQASSSSGFGGLVVDTLPHLAYTRHAGWFVCCVR